MKAIEVDFDYLLFAYRDESPDNIYYLDTEYGSIRLVHKQLQDLRDLTDEIEISHNRFLYVPKARKEDLLSDLHNFTEQIEDKNMKNLLALAFESPFVVDTFKKIISQNPQLLEKLEIYLQNKAKECLLEWLAANAIGIAQSELTSSDNKLNT